LALIGEKQTLVDICSKNITVIQLINNSEAALHQYFQDRLKKEKNNNSNNNILSTNDITIATLRMGWEKGRSGREGVI